ncbi:MAG: hypothetical protein ABI367_06750 [Mucilaginibacter sp.]
MNFKAYDILSSIVPGFLILMALLMFFDTTFDKDMIIPYTVAAFLLGYTINTFSSWLEDFYFFTWGGKPSSKLLDGKGIWKVRFYHSNEVKQLLLSDSGNNSAKNDVLFAIAMRSANGEKDQRVEDFSALYAFSRVLLTTVLLGSTIILIQFYNDWRYYVILIPIIGVFWLRSKQRAYYYAREVLNVYLKKKSS